MDDVVVAFDQVNARGEYAQQEPALWPERSSAAGFHTPGNRLYAFTKRLMDVVIATLTLVLTSPVLILLVVAIRLSSRGPSLFRQNRIGQFGHEFAMWKFRTMAVDADEDLHRRHCEVLALRAAAANPPPIRLPDDPRVTRLGALLRRWSLDELPNLWNVVKGEMSLVGPRPLVPYEIELYDAQHLRRLEVPPGITGLAQVSGRLDISLTERGRLDVWYVEQRSLTLDLAIMIRTPSTLVRRTNVTA